MKPPLFQWRVIPSPYGGLPAVEVTDLTTKMSALMVMQPGQTRDEVIALASQSLRIARRDRIHRRICEREGTIG